MKPRTFACRSSPLHPYVSVFFCCRLCVRRHSFVVLHLLGAFFRGQPTILMSSLLQDAYQRIHRLHCVYRCLGVCGTGERHGGSLQDMWVSTKGRPGIWRSTFSISVNKYLQRFGGDDLPDVYLVGEHGWVVLCGLVATHRTPWHQSHLSKLLRNCCFYWNWRWRMFLIAQGKIRVQCTFSSTGK